MMQPHAALNSPATTARAGARLAPLFLISAAAVGFETALTRYFAAAKWSEYGYWVISIVMVGFALSGVAMALTRPWALRHGAALLRVIPILLIGTAALGYAGMIANPFNPLQLQNPATYGEQIGNIALYYAVLFPFFFLAGFYISLIFVLNEFRIPKVYGFDLTGAALGSATVLALMFVLKPFDLPLALLPVLAGAALIGGGWRTAVAALAMLVASEAVLVLGPQADFNDFKAIYAPLHVEGSKIAGEYRSPRGWYLLLDDFTERLDTDVSNDAAMLGLAGPPRTLGIYRDGNRLAAVPNAKAEGTDAAYAPATLGALPYLLRPGANVLLGGASGGFRIAEAVKLGAASVVAAEPEPVLREAMRRGMGPSPAMAADRRILISEDAPIALALRDKFGLIDISADFLDGGEANATSLTSEAIAAYLASVTPGGLVSIPVSIRDLPVYAMRMLATVRDALRASGIAAPENNVVVYRSAWNARILISPTPFTAAEIAAMREFCEARSFDLSWYPGFDQAPKAEIFNDLPAVSFETGSVVSGEGAHDAVAEEAGAVLRGEPTASQAAFALDPATMDRPSFYAVLRLAHLGTILQRLEILPQPEIGQLVNLAVLAQAVLIALLVLAVPLLRRRGGDRAGLPSFFIPRAVVYFAALGLGFLFLEIWLIEQASFYLNDRITAFAVVLTGMLLFSGLGSMLAENFAHGRLAGRGVVIAVLVAVVWGVLMALFARPLMLASLDMPFVSRVAIVLLALAPVSLALGLPFPIGLGWAGSAGGFFLPWAWGLNGAFSVVATPLANLIAIQAGHRVLLLAALLFYGLCLIVEPSRRTILSWQNSPAR